MKNLLPYPIILFLSFLLFSCDNNPSVSNDDDSFSFVFMTDIHLEQGRNAVAGFEQALDTINKIHPDFVLTGGDLIKDALERSHETADSLYELYNQTISKLDVPVYNTVGNHELFGIYEKSGISPTDEDYDLGKFKKYIGEPYYSFDHKGWHFMVLHSAFDTPDRQYIGKIDSAQINWIKDDLSKIDKKTPIVISVHIPFVSALAQFSEGSLAPNSEGLVVSNSRDVLMLFNNYNLKLVLQGHLHYLEEINAANKIKFITGGAVSAGWWNGAHNFTEEGFLKLTLSKDEVNWEYVDYGWEVN